MSQPLWRRPVVVIPAAVVLVGGAVVFGLRSGKSNAANTQASATNEQLYTVEPTTMQQTVSASGTIAPTETDDLSFTSAGTVTAVNVRAGQKVKKGAVLATIDSAALQSALQQANASYQSAQAQLTDDQAASASSAQLASDEANVAAQNAGVEAAYADLLAASLKSPIDGTVATVNLTVGQALSSTGGSGTDIAGTANGSGRSPSNGSNSNGNNANASNSSSAQVEIVSNSFVVDLSVDTATVGKVKVGETATVTPTTSSGTSRGNGGFGFPGGGFAIANFGGGGNGTSNGNGNSQSNTAVGASANGTVTSVGTVATSSSGVATFPVVIAITGTPAAFHAGASASAAIAYSEKANVLAVPVNAVTQSGSTSSVTVSTNGKTTKRTVTTGITANGQIEITSGIRSGEQVVVTLPNFARNGARTRNGSNGGGNFQFPGGGFTTGRGGG
jgi:multidrug efflux pump subunit AcrA (membrane-fusion protein)